MLVMVFIVGSYMSSSSMTSCTPVVRNKMEIYTIKASINQAFRPLVLLLKGYNIVVDLNMVNEDRTTVVCPHCHAPYKRVRPRDDKHVHPHRVMLCEKPQCRGAQWRTTVPDALNVDHRDKSAAENILWRSLATEDELGRSPFSRTVIPRLPTSFQSIINWLTATIRLLTDDVVQFGTLIVPFRPCLGGSNNVFILRNMPRSQILQDSTTMPTVVVTRP
ncbi:hypothetical protein J8273_4891 [Carpediemonas membranifera]|uniref:Uncharacterized protein n=1 Tax=Carpediemonas membranifera TaxID=201153 RepID=A0A8J6E3T2_9EUKA|nr:hypothetical protein J8273_4891 [Carpediemonas membranifera]|eukprot:KAG9393592.1 hypothetical protein J8273_4891 [Carpediemonas membranifera]